MHNYSYGEEKTENENVYELMKIGILTQPLHSNYGGLLQNFALQTVLKRMGHDVLTIDVRHSLSKSKWYLLWFKELVKKILGREYNFPIAPRHQGIIRQYTDVFIDKNIAVTEPFYRIKDNVQEKYHFDAYVVGSDQVWRPCYNPNIQDMFLKFLGESKVKRIAYAASFGTDIWEYNLPQEYACAELAQKFDAISVREVSGIELCKKYFNVNATHVLDPTMLLSKEDYVSFIGPDNYQKGNQLVVYILDSSAEKNIIIEEVAERMNLQICYVGNPNTANVSLDYRKRIVPPIEEWLIGFKKADFIITDSFHGTVFSIIFNKPFICIGNIGRGLSRFSSLLNVFGLNDRLIYSNKQLTNELLDSSIDFNIINNVLDRERVKSIGFLTDALLS